LLNIEPFGYFSIGIPPRNILGGGTFLLFPGFMHIQVIRAYTSHYLYKSITLGTFLASFPTVWGIMSA